MNFFRQVNVCPKYQFDASKKSREITLEPMSDPEICENALHTQRSYVNATVKC